MIYHGRRAHTPNLDGLTEEVYRATQALTPLYGKYDGLVAQGMSGVIPAVPVSLALHVDLVVVRKHTDRCHETRHINLDLVTPGSRWIFIDDFISMGTTRTRVQQAIAAKGGHVVGQYMCREREFTPLELYTGDLGPEAPNYTPAAPTFNEIAYERQQQYPRSDDLDIPF